MPLNADEIRHGINARIKRDPATWTDIQDVPQQEIENAAHKLICLVRDGEGVHITDAEAHALLCCMRTYSSLASRHLDS